MNLTTEQRELININVIQCLDFGIQWEDKNQHFPADAIISEILKIEGVTKDDSDKNKNDGFETNGWDYDWWQDFKFKGETYTLSGSGYYGGHAFSKSEDFEP